MVPDGFSRLDEVFLQQYPSAVPSMSCFGSTAILTSSLVKFKPKMLLMAKIAKS